MADLDGGDPFSPEEALVIYDGGDPFTDFGQTGIFQMRRLSALTHLVQPYAGGAPRIMIENALRYSAIEFCERTRCWRYICAMPMVANNSALICPDFATIHEIETAYWGAGDHELKPTQFSELPPSVIAAQEAGVPRYVTQIGANSVAVMPFQEGTLRITVFLKPRSSDQEFGSDASDRMHDRFNQIPDFMAVQHSEPLAWGALSRMLLVKDTEFHDPKLATHFRGQFEKAMDAKFSSNMTGQQRARRRTKIQFL
ncbi:hypothetical protein [Salipiger sp.]|uniref:phage adaptor protein n=1 Tax=Salipiger sp. TaxID=2078585 RepID=UPI003A97C1CA